MDDKFCPCCKNRCPVDSLSCGRGRAYFGMGGGVGESSGKQGGHGSHGFPEGGDEIVNLLRKCGHTLHHAYGHGDVRIDCLTEEERTQLIALLNKCIKSLEE